MALSDSGMCLNYIDKEPDEYIHGEFLTLFIEELLIKSQKSVKDLKAISVSIGPGSYTGLRIGLSVAKGLCFGLKIPLITVPTLDCLLELGRVKHPKHTLCAVLDARRMEVYSKIVSDQGDCFSEAKATIIDENSFKEFEPYVYFGDGSSKLKAIWSGRDVRADEDLKLSSLGQISQAINKYRNRDFDDLAYIKPMYIKEFKIS